MPKPYIPGLTLRAREGRYERAEYEVQAVEGGGCWLWAACTFDSHEGGHWLAETPNGRVVRISQPYVFATRDAAYDALERWKRQDAAKWACEGEEASQ